MRRWTISIKDVHGSLFVWFGNDYVTGLAVSGVFHLVGLDVTPWLDVRSGLLVIRLRTEPSIIQVFFFSFLLEQRSAKMPLEQLQT